jgi:hypothetical protein
MIFLKGLAVWCVIILAETLHGTIRTLWLAPTIGDLPARQVSFFTGVVLILTIATLFIQWLHASYFQLFAVGVLWATLTLLFEIGLGRLILDYSWEHIWADYNLFQGGLMTFGLVVLIFAPLIATKLRGQLSKATRFSK